MLMDRRSSELVVITLLALLSLQVALVTFGVLRSSAHLSQYGIDLGGAAAGFVATFLLLWRSLGKLRENVLDVPESIALTSLYQEGIKARALLLGERLLRDLREGRDLPSADELASEIEGLFMSHRQYLAAFRSQLGELVGLLYAAYPADSVREECAALMDHLRSSQLNECEKLERVRKLIEARQEEIRTKLLLRAKGEKAEAGLAFTQRCGCSGAASRKTGD